MAAGHQPFTKTGHIFKAPYLDFVVVDASRIKQKGKEEKRIEFTQDVKNGLVQPPPIQHLPDILIYNSQCFQPAGRLAVHYYSCILRSPGLTWERLLEFCYCA